MRILVIDDEPEILELVTQFLNASSHHEAKSASSAKAALEMIADAEVHIDCFLVDIQMPEVDGIALVSLIRTTPGYQHTPIIMLTAMQDKDYLDRAFAAGATDYATKPFDFEDPRRRIQAAQKLAVGKARERTQPLMAGEFKGMSGEPKDIRRNDPMPLAGVEVAIDYDEFENYVLELLRRRPVRAKTIAVKIGNFDRTYEECTSDDLGALVHCAAVAVQETLLAEGGVLSYRGSGVFLCVLEGRLKNRRGILENTLNSRVRGLHPNPERDIPSLLVGGQVSLGDGSTLNALEALALAVDSAESRNVSFGDLFEVPKRFFKSQRLSHEQQHLEKRAFESLLHDALKEPKDDDAWSRRLLRQKDAPG